MNPRILLIEDDPHIRRFLRASLNTQGYELLEAGTGQQGLSLAASQVPDKVANLDAGADDYLTKPFGVGELLARIRAALRRAGPGEEGQSAHLFTLGKLRVDFDRRQVLRGEEQVHLTPIEYKLLSVLIKHQGKVVTHRQLLKEVWGPSFIEQHPYLRIFILNLRRKLEDDPTRPHYLITEPGVGYRLRGE
jgi:two-component system KDP operon response regulator KdpE